jgi:hypothetical protein
MLRYAAIISSLVLATPTMAGTIYDLTAKLEIRPC